MVLNYYKKVTDFMNIPGKLCEIHPDAVKKRNMEKQKEAQKYASFLLSDNYRPSSCFAFSSATRVLPSLIVPSIAIL